VRDPPRDLRARKAPKTSEKAQLRYDANIDTAATNAIADRGVFGIVASQLISRPTGADDATAYPPMTIIAICRVNSMSTQNPAPQASMRPTFAGASGSAARWSSGSPVARPRIRTRTVPTSTNPNASGNHRSLNAVNRSAQRETNPSLAPVAGVLVVVIRLTLGHPRGLCNEPIGPWTPRLFTQNFPRLPA
jgi:hypothetical protein